jgi:hypothetical protein
MISVSCDGSLKRTGYGIIYQPVPQMPGALDEMKETVEHLSLVILAGLDEPFIVAVHTVVLLAPAAQDIPSRHAASWRRRSVPQYAVLPGAHLPFPEDTGLPEGTHGGQPGRGARGATMDATGLASSTVFRAGQAGDARMGDQLGAGHKVSDSGSRMGATTYGPVRLDAVNVTACGALSRADASGQPTCTCVRAVRDEEAAGSNPANPTIKVTQVEAAPSEQEQMKVTESEVAIS